ncbi:hypothetical protein CPB84DRAFT_1686882 [Gymnopilus junonius]|uniref:AAA+ ATPase domain-containing protein n=1 Tax=Gymnopilus junonius TaxID=109634 RepID=A0A9P5THM9_GYMJU|nr:hypothetical protein CPB84DRAFT_1686882 [Gymnopilus junonius]
MPDDTEPKIEKEPTPEYTTSSRGRKVQKKKYVESSDNEMEEALDGDATELFNDTKSRKVTRASSKRQNSAEDEDEDDHIPGRYSLRTRQSKNLQGFIASDDDEHLSPNGGYSTRRSTRRLTNRRPLLSEKEKEAAKKQSQAAQREQRISRRNASRVDQHGEKDWTPDHESSGASADADGSLEDAPQTSSDLEPEPEPELEPEPEPEEEVDGRPYSLRQRKEINYAIPPPLEESRPPPRHMGGRNGRTGGGGGGGGKGKSRLGWSASGKELGKWMGMPADDSDSDYPTRTPRKPYGGIGSFGGGAIPAGGMMPGDLTTAGTPSNLGKIGDSALADADPLGVNLNVTFDEVGGLEEHVRALKDMTLLPLLYPEVFQRFNVTPPRGVLFHGPPGTGKTLMARALAASCQTGGRKIAFFMRKGADCLSKWVGEAERQLRLLFEEARNSQPSIIFFDEIDGLAPVRSSKQDQIHASIVSTLLALMDGMDGRGQVIVIGATNRPDAVDPALRRPGRFDREFYFGLPGLEAREKILSIMTRKWEGWGGGEDEKTEEKEREIKDKVHGLAKLTKGYGGADLRALCTESSLNAIQRRYPQVYKSNDRLLLQPETIQVGLRDFMISIKKLVPSSARSSSSAATPLPTQFIPLLDNALEKVKEVIQRVIPIEKRLTALEEAEFEDVGGEQGALEKEMLSQAMQTLRVYRPRVVIHGPVGMGQGYIGAAALHHLEGYHVQSLELGTLMSDSTRTVEAAIVQLFVEAKRNQPSVIYIPSLIGWCAAVSETSRSTVRAMLDTLLPTDPILLLAVVDGKFSELPKDVRAWFGPTKDNRIFLSTPTESQREAFFEGLINDVERPPNKFADGMPRKKRILEELPIAPPLEPRKPTAAELQTQLENDQRVLTLLKYRLGPILTELKRKFKRFTKRATEEYNFDPDYQGNGLDTVTTTMIEVHQGMNGIIDITGEPSTQPTAVDQGGPMNGIVMEQQQIMQQRPPLYDMDLERMQMDLFKGRYLTPQDFLDDVGKMLHNAEVRQHEDLERLHRAQAMYIAAEVSIQEFDPQLRIECERMAVRERQRREAKREKGKGKDKEVNGTPAPTGTRRSARANGLQPEHPITDPVKLERRLKRMRGEESSGVDSHGSEGEANGINGVDPAGRDAKRTRIIEDREDDRDPLDTLGSNLGSSRPGSEVRSHVVRFAPQYIEPMAPLFEVPQMGQYPQQPHPPHPNQLPISPHPSLHQNHIQLNHVNHHNHMPSHAQFPDHMMLDGPSLSSTPTDRTLLNPVLQHHQQPMNMFNNNGMSPYGAQRVSDHAYSFPTMSEDPTDPFLSPPQQQPYQEQQPQPTSFMELLQRNTPTPPVQSFSQVNIQRNHIPVPQIQLAPQQQQERQLTPLPLPAVTSTPVPPPPAKEPSPMIVERARTPTPPLPEFRVSFVSVSNLRRVLKESTIGLTVEELEQLRATCLGTVWRHRKEWDRDALVEQLIKDVKEFVAEVKADEENDADD